MPVRLDSIKETEGPKQIRLSDIPDAPLSRRQLADMGVADQTNLRQRQVITDVLKRKTEGGQFKGSGASGSWESQAQQDIEDTGEAVYGPSDVFTTRNPAITQGPGAQFTKGVSSGFWRQTQLPALAGRKIPEPETKAENIGEMVGGTIESIAELVTMAKILKGFGLAGKFGKTVVGTAAETGLLFGAQETTQQARKGIAENLYKDDYGYEGGKAVLESIAFGAILSLAGSGMKGLGKAIWSKLKPTEKAKALRMLGLRKGASIEAINKAARKEALKYHPDKVKGMSEQFKKVMAARDLLRKDIQENIIVRGAGKAGKTIKRGKLLPSQIRPPEASIMAEPSKGAIMPVEPTSPEISRVAAQIKPVAGQVEKPKKGTVAAREAQIEITKAQNDKQAKQVIQNMDNAGSDDGKPNVQAYDAPEFKKAVVDLVGKKNWEIAQAQSKYERRTKTFKPESLEAITLNIQYRERPELLETFAKLPKTQKYAKAIEHSKNLTAKEKAAVAEIESEYAADLKRAQEFGVIESSREYYINQVWQLPKEGKGLKKAQQFGQKMAESKERKILGGYLEGIQLGFEPVTLNAAKLRRIYQENLAKAIHEKTFLDTIRDMRNAEGDPILTKIAEDTDWTKYKMIDHPALKNYRFKGSQVTKGEQSGVFGTPTETQRTVFLEKTPMAVHKDAAPQLKALLMKSKLRDIPVIKQALTFTATGKYMLLSFSGFHHTALGKTAVFYGVNPMPFGGRSYISGLDLIENNDPIVKLLVEKGGLTLGQSNRLEFIKDVAGEPFEWLGRKAGLPGQAVNKAKQWWDKGLWDHYYVGLKSMSGKIWFNKVKGMYPQKSDAEVAKIVANEINNNYGGLNWELLGISKTHLDVARLLLLAPDWTISNWRFFIDAGKVSTGYQAARKRIAKRDLSAGEALFLGGEDVSPATRYMGRVIGSLGLLTAAVNLALWGKIFPHEPDDLKSKWYMVKLPFKTKDGGYYYLDIFGHFFEPIRAVSSPIRWFKGKRSVGWKTVEESITGRDWKGDYIKSTTELFEGIKEGDYSLYKSRYDMESTGWGAIPTRVIHGTTSFIPIPVQTAVDVGTGNKSAIEATSSLGIAVRRGRKPQIKRKKREKRDTKKQREFR